MNMSSRKKIIWWWGWNPEPLEKELEAMAEEGWFIEKVDGLGVYFTFRKQEPMTLCFATDYQPEATRDYFEIFKEDGWDMEWSGANGWYIFSKAYAGERPAIYTDKDSIIDRNHRILKVLLPLFIMLVVLFVTVVLPILRKPIYVGVYGVALALYTYIFLQVWLHNKKLREQP